MATAKRKTAKQLALFGSAPRKKTPTKKRKTAPKKKTIIKVASKKTLGQNDYIVLSNVKGTTNIASLEKKYKGEYRSINGKNVIVRPKAAPRKKAVAKRKPSVRATAKKVTLLERKLKVAKKKLTKVRRVAKTPKKRVVKKAK